MKLITIRETSDYSDTLWVLHTFNLIMFVICWLSLRWFHNTCQYFIVTNLVKSILAFFIFFYMNEPWLKITAGGCKLINAWVWTFIHMTDAAWLKFLRSIEIAYLAEENQALFLCFGCCAFIQAVDKYPPFQLCGTHCVFWHKMTYYIFYLWMG